MKRKLILAYFLLKFVLICHADDMDRACTTAARLGFHTRTFVVLRSGSECGRVVGVCPQTMCGWEWGKPRIKKFKSFIQPLLKGRNAHGSSVSWKPGDPQDQL